MAKNGSLLSSGTVPSQPHPTPRPRPLKRLHSAISKRSPQFPQFSRLPAELREIIWGETFPGPRVHELHPCGKIQNGRLMFRSNASTPPVALQVCQESRAHALKHFQLMEYDPRFPAKPTRKFYFNPQADTLFLNTLTALYMTVILLENVSEEEPRLGVMKGWQNLAFDADRARILLLLSGNLGGPPRPNFKRVFPDMNNFIVAFDSPNDGKTRFRASVWPGENGTNLMALKGDTTNLMSLFEPIREYLEKEYGVNEEGECMVELTMANVKRNVFLRGTFRYGFRRGCAFLGLTPRGVFRLL